MKKRFLSLLMALCLMLTLAPAALAVEEDTGRPAPTELPIVNEEDMVTLDAIPAPMAEDGEIPAVGWSGSGSQDDPYLIYTGAGLKAVGQRFQNYVGPKYVRLETSIDLTGTTVSEWAGYFNYFEGVFDGNDKTISNLPENCYLFFQIHNATIKDLTLDLNGKAGTLVYYSFRVQKSDGTIEWGEDTMSNITVKSDTTIQLVGNDQANYSPFLYSSSPKFTMDGCVNYADISGNTYAAVFYGYYPLPLDISAYPTDASVKIQNCANHGDISLRYAGLVFGNPTGFRSGDRGVEITDVVNYGKFRGTETAHWFCSDAGGSDIYQNNDVFMTQEKVLEDSKNMTKTCEESGCPHFGETGAKCEGSELVGLSITLDEDSDAFVVTPASNAPEGATYYVTVYHYVNIFNPDGPNGSVGSWEGSTRISLSEKVSAATGMKTSRIIDAMLCDGVLPDDIELEDKDQCLYFSTASGTYGYWLDNGDVSKEGFYQFINRNMQPGSVQWNVYVSVYDSDGNLLDTAALVR